MRLQGLFLRSAVARRVFWALLATAVLPLLLLGSLCYGAFAERITADQQRADQELLKQTGLRLFDRLSAARVALASHAASDRWRAPALFAGEARSALADIATVQADGRLVGGSSALAAAWRRIAGPAVPAAHPRMLWWVAPPAGPAQVLVVLDDSAHRGLWIGAIDPGFLWSDFVTDGAASSICVDDSAGRRLHCGTQGAAADARRWTLFLDGAFATPPWHLSGGSATASPALESATLGRWAAEMALLTLLLVATVSLVLVRRAMLPLEALTALTRRLAAQDWGARAEVARGNEFGELAAGFNTMAERIGRQMQAMQVQAEIDGDILAGEDIGQVMRRVAVRLQALLPQAQVAVVARRPGGGGWHAYRADQADGAPVALDGASAAALPDGPPDCHGGGLEPVPAWLRQALPVPAAAQPGLCWVPARWQDELVAMLVLWSAQPLQPEPDLLREIHELRDRVAVTLAAATREHHLIERAVRDRLTGLLNGSGIQEACDRMLPGAAAAAPFSMLFIDLDAFKEVNDSLGHAAGDELLQRLAQRMRDAAPAGALLARPGGDEFVVLVPGPAAAAGALAQRLCHEIARPCEVRGLSLQVGASIGIASCPEHATERDELMRRADLAMYAAKGAGRGRWRIYDAELDTRLAEKAWLVRELRTALDASLFNLHYQPRVDLHSGQVHSAEALIRWTHASAGVIPPQRFIPVAEQAGLIESIGHWVLDAALRQMRRWREARLPVGRVAVNVSTHQLRDDGFAALVFGLLAGHGLRPQDLEIEITESLFVGDVDAVCARLAPLRDAGVLIALDDFGTGYSSLSALHRLPVDVLKIDRSFVVDLGDRASADAVARSIVALARALGKRVVAEGVETTQQLLHLRALGCDEIQGYLYARPMPPGAFDARVLAGFADTPVAALAH